MLTSADEVYGTILSHTLIPVAVVLAIELFWRKPGDAEALKTLLVVTSPFASMAILYYLGFFDKYIAASDYSEL